MCAFYSIGVLVGDNWRLEVSGGTWKRGDPVKIVHVDTNKYLHSHNMKFGSPIQGIIFYLFIYYVALILCRPN